MLSPIISISIRIIAMHQACATKELQFNQLREDLENCAYTVFAAKNISDIGKPDFLKTKRDLRADFKSYAVSNHGEICRELQKMHDPIERICITYSLLEFIGDYFPKDNYQYLQKSILFDYFGMIMAFRVIKTSPLMKESNKFMCECLELILPVALPLFIKVTIAEESLQNLDLLNQITTVHKLFDFFVIEYTGLVITSLEDYLVWLHECLYFLYILLHQNCTGLEIKYINKTITFIKLKLEGVESRSLLVGNGLDKIQLCLRMLLTIDSKILPENAGVYYATRPALLSLVLDILLSMPHELKAKQHVDTYTSLCALWGVKVKPFIHDMKYFAVESLIELTQIAKSEALVTSRYFVCLKYFGLILEQSMLSDKCYAGAKGRVFFESTQDDFEQVFKMTIATIAQLFYSNPDKCYKSLALHTESRESKGMDSHDFFILMDIYKKYQDVFPPAAKLLPEFYIINFDAIFKAKAWGNTSACSLLKKVISSLASCGIQEREIDFITIKKAYVDLIQRSSLSAQIMLTDDDLVFWKMVFEVFSSMQNSMKAWSLTQQHEIDELFLAVLSKISFDEDNSGAIIVVKLCVIMLNTVSITARFEFYQHMDKVLRVINKQYLDSSTDLVYQSSLIKKWLCEDIEQGSESFNSRVLAQVQGLSQEGASPISRVLYLCKLSEILYLLTLHAECFYIETELYGKIEEIITFIFKERLELGSIILAIDAIPFSSKVAIVLSQGQSFLDPVFMDLIQSKIPEIYLKSSKTKAAGRHNKYEVLAITKVAFTQDKIMIHCSGAMFSLPLRSMPHLNILKSQVREYKKQGAFCLFTGNEAAQLMSLTSEVVGGAAVAVAILSDEKLFALFEGDELAVTTKPGKKTAATKSSSTEVVAKIKKPSHGKANKPAKKSTAAAVMPLDKKPDLSAVSSAAAESLQAEVAIKTKKPSQNKRVPAAVSCKVYAASSVAVTIKPEKLDELPSYPKDTAAEAADFLAAIEADSFARLVYNDDGAVVRVAPAKILLEYFALPVFGVKKGLVKAVGRIKDAFLKSIQDKLKVVASLEGSTLSLVISFSEVRAATISSNFITESCDLRSISSGQLWPELVKMHASLLQQLYGGNSALAKLEFDAENKIIAIDVSEGLASTALQRVEIAADNLRQAFEAFFEPLDSATFKLFGTLVAEQVEFIIRIAEHAEDGIFIYGHPVVEYYHGNNLRVLGVDRLPLQQLVIRLNNSCAPTISILRDILTSSLMGAFIKGVRPQAIYCSYQGCDITICLDHNDMVTSIFHGDHFCCLIEKDTYAYSEPVTNPSELGPVVVAGSKSGDVIFAKNPYALKVAFDWFKIMGNLCGDLRVILENLGLLRVITAPGFEGKIWNRATGSLEFLPSAINYLQSEFHLSSEADANAVLKEASSMLECASSP
jgi:hypothetical protein